MRAGEGDLDRLLPLTSRLFAVYTKVRKREAPKKKGHRCVALEAEMKGSVDDLVLLNRHWCEGLERPPAQAASGLALPGTPNASA